MFKFLHSFLCGVGKTRLSNCHGFVDGDDDDDVGKIVVDDDDDLDDDKKKEDDASKKDIGDEPEVKDKEVIDDGGMDIDLDDDDVINRDKKAHNKAFAEMRKSNATLKKQLEEQNARIAQLMSSRVEPPRRQDVSQPQREVINGTPVPQTDQEWDELAKTNWKLAVDMRSLISAKNVVTQTNEVDKATETLNKSKTIVLERHPELDDAFSEKSKIYKNILDKNPHYISDPRGPIHAMRDMEEYMEFDLGLDRSEILKSLKKPVAKKDSSREDRTKILSTQGRNSTASNVIRLDKDEIEFCKYNGIDPKEYAKNKKSLAKPGKGGLQ